MAQLILHKGKQSYNKSNSPINISLVHISQIQMTELNGKTWRTQWNLLLL